MYCEFFTRDWIVVASTVSFLLGTTLTVACVYFQNDSVDLTLKKHEDELKTVSARVEEIHAQYENDMLTLLRETLRPSSSQRSIVSEVTDVQEEDEPVMDNNSIPAGPSGPI